MEDSMLTRQPNSMVEVRMVLAVTRSILRKIKFREFRERRSATWRLSFSGYSGGVCTDGNETSN